jgi:YD repeat-containing protein
MCPENGGLFRKRGHDAAGRMTGEKDNGGPTITFSYDAANELINDSSNTYTGGQTMPYDNEGHLTNTGYSVNADKRVAEETASFNRLLSGHVILPILTRP